MHTPINICLSMTSLARSVTPGGTAGYLHTSAAKRSTRNDDSRSGPEHNATIAHHYSFQICSDNSFIWQLVFTPFSLSFSRKNPRSYTARRHILRCCSKAAWSVMFVNYCKCRAGTWNVATAVLPGKHPTLQEVKCSRPGDIQITHNCKTRTCHFSRLCMYTW